jgi:uncharacterized protein DUF1566
MDGSPMRTVRRGVHRSTYCQANRSTFMRTPRGILGWILALVAVVSIVVFRLPAVSGQSEISPAAQIAGPPWRNPDPPCFDNTSRYVNCGNGTVTDTGTGQVWLQDAGCLTFLNWAEANQAAAVLRSGQCGLTDRSKPGDWRLPSNAEWRAMVDAARNHPNLHCTSPALTDDSGSACFGNGSSSSFSNVSRRGDYWSSSTNTQSSGLTPDGTRAGTMDLNDGFLAGFVAKLAIVQAWPVRVR